MTNNHFLKRLLRDQRGASAVEYGLIVSMIVLAMLAGLGNFSGNVMRQWNMISDRTSEAMN